MAKLSDTEKCQLLLEDFSNRIYQEAELSRKQASIFSTLAEKIQDRRIARFWNKYYEERWHS